MTERISYWLIPAGPDKAHFARIISELAQRFGAPAFEPHVTLYSTVREAGDDPGKIIHAAAKGIAEIRLFRGAVGGSTEFTKTLFVEFSPTPPLLALSSELKRRSANPAPYELKPHLSLIYAPLAAEVKRQLAETITAPATVRFAAVKAIVGRERTRTGEDVRAWRVLAEVPLAVP